MNRKKVLFVCTHNSARSQMAEALLNHLGSKHYLAFSAGTEPGGVNIYTREVMEEISIDMVKHHSKHINEFIEKGEEFDLVITVCDNAREACPIYPGGKQRFHKSFPDPTSIKGTNGEILISFRNVRDMIAAWIKEEFLTC